jgi:hypothetical protein
LRSSSTQRSKGVRASVLTPVIVSTKFIAFDL